MTDRQTTKYLAQVKVLESHYANRTKRKKHVAELIETILSRRDSENVSRIPTEKYIFPKPVPRDCAFSFETGFLGIVPSVIYLSVMYMIVFVKRMRKYLDNLKIGSLSTSSHSLVAVHYKDRI